MRRIVIGLLLACACSPSPAASRARTSSPSASTASTTAPTPEQAELERLDPHRFNEQRERSRVWLGLDAPLQLPADHDPDDELMFVELADKLAVIAKLPAQLHVFVVAIGTPTRVLWPEDPYALTPAGDLRVPSTGWLELGPDEDLAVVIVRPDEMLGGGFESILWFVETAREQSPEGNAEDVFATRPRRAGDGVFVYVVPEDHVTVLFDLP